MRPPDTLPEMERAPRVARRYQRPRRVVSWAGIILGLMLGVGGGLLYTWVLNPVQEFDTQPWQLTTSEREQFIVAIMIEYNYTGDFDRAFERLAALRPQRDPIQEVADIACSLATSGYANNNSGLQAIRAMIRFYELQGRDGCATDLIIPQNTLPPVVVMELPTSTLAPPDTKTPTLEAPIRTTTTATLAVVPTNLPQSDYEIANIPTLCNLERQSLIEVNVVDFNGQGIPGQVVRVRWDGGESIFATGLKPERGAGYADFAMSPGISYVVDMPGLSDPSQPLTATACTLEDGARATISYRVVFRPTQ